MDLLVLALNIETQRQWPHYIHNELPFILNLCHIKYVILFKARSNHRLGESQVATLNSLFIFSNNQRTASRKKGTI